MTKSETNNDMDEKMANLRAKKKPAKLSGIDQSVLDLPEEHPLSYVNVKKYIATQEGLVKVGKQQQNMRSENQKLKDEGMRTRLDAEAYIRSMKKYLNSGDWSSLYYGEYEDKLIEWKVVAPSYK
jgi:hypothetical protein|tara:strand:+ start:1125 stop:1499 length:375 start_codon:yes stop_codon:yes gene_type:complete